METKETVDSMKLGISTYLRIPRFFTKVFSLHKNMKWECEIINNNGKIKLIYTLLDKR